MMKQVRIGVIGLGGMGSSHASRILAGEIPGLELTAVCDRAPERLEKFPEVARFSGSAEMVASGGVEAVLIATPHYSHTTLGIEALEAGLHVLVEKPISVHKADCERLIAAHRGEGQVFAAMFNQRTDPLYRKVKQLLDSGELGAVQRYQWTVTDWFRSQAYFDSGQWRATWSGEGGGVLLNQSPHNLDLMQWLLGMPESVHAHCAIARYHDIEVEDEVTALLRHADGRCGVFTTSTGEMPGVNRLEIAADRGLLTVEGGRIHFRRNEQPTSEYSRTTPERFAKLPCWEIEVPVSGKAPQHVGIMKNFARAILEGEPLIAPAAEGMHSVELANAMLLSTFENRTVELPIDGAHYQQLLEQKSRESQFVKRGVTSAAADEDFSKSFASA